MNSKKSINNDIIIIGAGAAGLMCAIEAAKRGRSVLILEHNSSIAKKIRISGGGRCNFTNIHAKASNYLSNNEHFAKSALARYTPLDFIELVKKYDISFHEKKLGQLFCDESSQQIINLLKKECDYYKVTILLETRISSIEKKDLFHLETTNGSFQSQSLVVACGGLSIPTLGATSLGYQVAEQFGIKVNPCRPGLVPLTLKDKDIQIFKELAGVSIDSLVSFEKISFRENTLFTHKGLSGPAILQISSYWQPKKPIFINMIPDVDVSQLLTKHQDSRVTLKNFLKDYLPTRLTEILCTYYLKNKPLCDYSPEERQTIAKSLNRWEFTPQGTEGYAKAEVTVGGIDTNELSSKTMESTKVPGLFFIGEVVDVTGHLGGFNFQWAWGSGFAAGQYA